MKAFTIIFYECEHYGDLDNYVDDMMESGARIDAKNLDYDNETGIVEASASNLKEFEARFKETDAYQFSSWLQ